VKISVALFVLAFQISCAHRKGDILISYEGGDVYMYGLLYDNNGDFAWILDDHRYSVKPKAKEWNVKYEKIPFGEYTYEVTAALLDVPRSFMAVKFIHASKRTKVKIPRPKLLAVEVVFTENKPHLLSRFGGEQFYAYVSHDKDRSYNPMPIAKLSGNKGAFNVPIYEGGIYSFRFLGGNPDRFLHSNFDDSLFFEIYVGDNFNGGEIHIVLQDKEDNGVYFVE